MLRVSGLVPGLTEKLQTPNADKSDTVEVPSKGPGSGPLWSFDELRDWEPGGLLEKPLLKLCLTHPL